MIRNYLKIALRNLQKNKRHAAINIFGLAMGFVVLSLSFIYIKSEWECDKWFADKEQIYRAYRNWGNAEGGWIGMPGPYAATLVDQIPGIEKATHLYPLEELLFTYESKSLYIDKIATIDSSFFQIFDFPFIYGDRVTAMNSQSGIVLSEKTAKKLFGEVNPVGYTLMMDGKDPLAVTGVIKEDHNKSHLDFNAYLRINEGYWTQWLNWAMTTYVKKSPKVAIADIENKATAMMKPIIVNAWKENGESIAANQIANFKFQPLEQIYLFSDKYNHSYKFNTSSINNLYLFICIALIVLLIAAINYMNLATAKATVRAKEIGVRKVTGAERGQLISQFLTESVFLTMIALGIALVLTEFLLPIFNQITARDLTFLSGGWLEIIISLIGIALIIGLLAGIYPAFVLSSYEPIKVLKGALLKNNSGKTFRKTLVVTQFSISVVLIISLLFIYKQVEYMQNQELGFKGNQVLNLQLNEYESAHSFLQKKNEFLNIPGVIDAAIASNIPGDPPSGMSIDIDGIEGMQNASMMWTSADYEKALSLEMKEGRYFSDTRASDTTQAVVVNEAFIDYFKIENPLEGKFKLFGQQEFSHIIGVVKNFHTEGLQNKIYPLFIINRPNWQHGYVNFKIAPTSVPQTISAIQEKWKGIEPLHPFRYSFLDDDFAMEYAEQTRFGQTIFYATLLAILIAALGLFGLSSYMAEQRTKEIGVRKVLGASMVNLINLLIKDFIKLVLIAGLLAIPVSYWLVNKWLEDFAYRTDINILPFIIAIFSALLLAIVTVSYQSLKVSAANPIKALKTE